MKLSDCTIGRLVRTNDKRVGHIIGLTYNVLTQDTITMTAEQRLERLIPLVRFPEGEHGVHHTRLQPFRG